VVYSKKSLLLVTLLLSVIVGAALVGSRVLTKLAPSETNTLSSVEIKEYQGQKLGSIDDFRENSIKGPQYIDVSTYRLVATGLVENETAYTYNDVLDKHTHYEKVVTIHCVEGWDVTILWEGVLVKDLLKEAGYNSSSNVVIFYAQDGYSTNLPLSYIINNNILIACKMNGVVLPPQRGFPFQLVAESKYGYKWIKWITRIEVSNDVSYRGYWESRGFSNDADLP
jgi:DMSO/TMAO reductase YedYZ molybdopterin-dependent catalytic subunit